MADRIPNVSERFLWNRHEEYLLSFEDDKESLLYFLNEQIRMGGVYWGITALDLLKRLDDKSGPQIFHTAEKTETEDISNINTTVAALDINENSSAVIANDGTKKDAKTNAKKELIDTIQQCRSTSGGYGPAVLHDPQLVHTHYAVLILAVYDELRVLDFDSVGRWIASLQNPDGSFNADKWGEVDSRFTYCALSCLTILNKLDLINVQMAAQYIIRCQNYDGGFGWLPGGESHAASTFCCIAALALAESLCLIDKDQLGWWLSERQTSSGGFNGRPEKAPDVCYSWWILATLHIIGRVDWISTQKLSDFILDAQDNDEGGISDRPGDVPDIFHTFFGIAALSLMKAVDGLKEIHPVYAIPIDTVERLNLPPILQDQRCEWQ